jgi:DNA repair protein RadD
MERPEVIQWSGHTFLEPQVSGVTKLLAALEAGEKRIVFVSPTGTGKTLMAGYSMNQLREQGKRVDLQTYRRLLLNQLSGEMSKFGIPHGVKASGMESRADASQLVQLVMTQTELSKSRRRVGYKRDVPNVMFLDEAHNQLGGESGEALKQMISAGMALVNVTATPVGISADHGTKLIEAGKNSEFRKLGLLLPCHVYGPDEPAAALKLKPTKTGEFREGDVVKAIMSPTIFGRVLEWYQKLNPHRQPAILFGPGVKESIWFAEQFQAAGIRAAHIDGEKIWLDGETHNKTQSLVDEIKRESELGRLPVVCNRFVLREGLDWPHLYHAILATVFGSLTGYLQSVGRLLRAHHSLDKVILQDHGGNWHRHGSPNADRVWTLGWDANRYAQERQQSLREKKEPEPIVCPKCGAIRLSGPECMTCHHVTTHKGRVVVQTDGSLKFVSGDIYKERKVTERSNTEKLWTACYFRCLKAKKPMTFKQAEACFFRENGYWPPKNLPFMPKNSVDWHAKIVDVNRNELIYRR